MALPYVCFDIIKHENFHIYSLLYYKIASLFTGASEFAIRRRAYSWFFALYPYSPGSYVRLNPNRSQNINRFSNRTLTACASTCRAVADIILLLVSPPNSLSHLLALSTHCIIRCTYWFPKLCRNLYELAQPLPQR